MKYFDEEDIIAEYEKQLQKKDNEIERLNNIINEAIEYIEDNKSYTTIEKWVAFSTYKKVDEDILDEDMINILLNILKGADKE